MSAQQRQFWNVPKLSVLTTGIPAEDIPSGGVAYEVAQEVDPDDLIRAEIYPPGQNLTMTEDTVPTFTNGNSVVTWRLWLNGRLLYIIVSGTPALMKSMLKSALNALTRSL